ncbi:ATP-dependent Clp protease ATP-binding subunit [candidate division KSB1 bacterium]|nr:ATP-dependent Clp protease ATP-binding subunit [candidate division KSB1 bacterium]
MKQDFSEQIHKILKYSREEALRLKNDFISTEHIMLGLLKYRENNVVLALLANLKCDVADLRQRLEKTISPLPYMVTLEDVPLTKRAENVLKRAWVEANNNSAPNIEVEHLFLALLQEKEGIAAKVLYSFDIDYEAASKELKSMNRGSATNVKKELNSLVEKQWGTDLTEMARNHKLDPVIGRENEITRLVRTLCRKKKNNPILIGEPGVGKTAIVEGLAIRIAENNVPGKLADTRIFSLDLTSLLAGTSLRGQLEERLQTIFKKLVKHKNIILFIDEIHTIVGTGGNNSVLDIANMLKPLLASGEIKCVGTTTLSDFRKHFEKDKALERRFQQIVVDSPSQKQAFEILQGLKRRYERYHRVKYTDRALRAAVQLSERYITDRFLPDKAIDLIDEAGARAHLRKTEKTEVKQLTYETLENDPAVNQFYDKVADVTIHETVQQIIRDSLNPEVTVITENDIAKTINAMTRIPVTRIKRSEAEKLLNLEAQLKRKVIGQNQAITAICGALKRARVGLKDPNKPIGSFIFVGPAGVGKTKLGQELAAELFENNNAFFQIDMSEYMEKFTVSRLIGAPPGYVGYEKGGELTEKVRRHPYSVIVFDGIEKAHPEVTNLLLQMLDEGTLTDSIGRRVDFRNTIIIMTVNHGFKTRNGIGFFDKTEVDSTAMGHIRKLFVPELINRIDDIVEFKPLVEEDIASIFELELKHIFRRMTEIDIELTISAAAKKLFIENVADSANKARSIKKLLREKIEDPIAEKIVKGDIRSGGRVHITADGITNDYTFEYVEVVA